ncbi:uncharacterized protein LOC143263768 [Megalopta genalis]|uniref:uncharacterized protein LOC143263768 n=1 Tax=Megalopta genalis TaxID=115081 RepID=UPI003FD1740A
MGNCNVRLKIRNGSRVVHTDKIKRAPTQTHHVQTITHSTTTTTGRAPQQQQYMTAGELQNRHQFTTCNAIMKTSTICIIVAIVESAAALIGYDCNSPTLNTSTISTINKPKCEYTDTKLNTSSVPIQLLQLVNFKDVPAFQCKVEIDRTIYHCGMYSHTSVVSNGRQEYILNTPRDICRTMHDAGILTLPPAGQVIGLERNSTTTRSFTLAGSIKQDGTCGGTTYSDPYGTWDNVVVQAIVKITLKTFRAPVKLNSNQLYLPNGQRCALSEEYCMDAEDGYTYWTGLPEDPCRTNNYNVLYEGRAIKATTKDNNFASIYTVTSGDTAFALTSTGRTQTCGYTLIKTEHPKLLILETSKEGKFKNIAKPQENNLDIFTYVNTKFVYVEKHLKSQIVALYKDMMKQKCQTEQQILKNIISLVHTSPAEVAATITREPGYMALPAGEVIYIVKCVPVQCTLRKTDDCFDELPVSYRNGSFFLTPKTRILVRTGTRRTCNELIPPTYRIHGTWYKFTPRPVESAPPPPLQPLTTSTWKYTDPSNLASGGIYTEEDLQKLNEHIMFPIERTAVVNALAQGASGRQYASDSIRMYNLMDEKTLQQIAESTGEKIWSGFVQFGSAMAGIIGIYIALRIVKLIVSTILNGIALHAAYGWSLQLLAACWSALAHFCLYLKDQDRGSGSEVTENKVPLECVTVKQNPISENPSASENPNNPKDSKKESLELYISRTPQYVRYKKVAQDPEEE